MAWVFEKSPTWRRIVAKTRESPSFYAGFAAACFVVPYGLGKAVMWATNPEVARKRDMALQAELKGRQTYHHEVSHAEWLHSNAGANSVESVWQRYINGPQSSVLQLRVLVCMYVCVCVHMQRLSSLHCKWSFRLPTGILCGHAKPFGKDCFCVSQPPMLCACRVSQKQIDKGLPSCWGRFKAVNTVKIGMRQH